MERLSWRSILQRVEGGGIVALWYGVEDGYLRLELDDGSVLLVAACWEEGCHVVVDPAVPATRKRPASMIGGGLGGGALPRGPRVALDTHGLQG